MKDGWDKAAVVGGLALPLVLAVVGAGLGWLGGRAQRANQEIASRTAQASAIATLLDALTDETCAESSRKSVAIRLVYLILDDEEAAGDMLLAVNKSPSDDATCSRLAAQVFRARLPTTAPDLAEAVDVLVGESGPQATEDQVDATTDDTQAQEAIDTLLSSRYAALLIPATIEAGLTSLNEQAVGNAAALLGDVRTRELGLRSAYLTAIDDAYLQEPSPAPGEQTGSVMVPELPELALERWQQQVAPRVGE